MTRRRPPLDFELDKISRRCKPADKSGHLFDYANDVDMQGRSHLTNMMIKCRCARCGRMFVVDYGLQLQQYGNLMPLYQYGVMFA